MLNHPGLHLKAAAHKLLCSSEMQLAHMAWCVCFEGALSVEETKGHHFGVLYFETNAFHKRTVVRRKK